MSQESEIVLRMLKEGKISVEEADALLKALDDEGADTNPPTTSGSQTPLPPRPPEGVGARGEWRELVDELTASIPREILRETRRFRSAWGPGLSHMVEGLWGLVEGEAETTIDESMASGEELMVRNARGDVRLSASEDAQVHVKARKRVWAPTAAEASRLAEELSIGLRRTGMTMRLDVPRVLERPVRVDLEIMVPSQVSVKLELAKGDVETLRLQGTLTAQISKGDVQVREHLGAVEVAVAKGNVRMSDVAEDAEIDVKHGEVTVAKVRGRVKVETAHGDIDVNDCAGLALAAIHGDISVAGATDEVLVEGNHGRIDLRDIRARRIEVRTRHGDVALELTDFPEQATILAGTVRGNVDLSLPSNARTAIEASVRAGHIRCQVPLLNRIEERGSLRGTFNGPGGQVRLRTTSGDIDIRTMAHE
jgi:hypothetical protein